MSKILQQVKDMAVANATGTNIQTISSMRIYKDKLKDSNQSAQEALKTAKASGDKKQIQAAKSNVKTVNQAQKELRTSKMLTLLGAGNSAYTNQALQNARNVASGNYNAVVEQGIVSEVSALTANRPLPDISESLESDMASKIESGLSM